MEIRRLAIAHSILIGMVIVGMWSLFLATGEVPESETKTIEISFT